MSTSTDTLSHLWVKHTVTPVHVLQDSEEELIRFVDPDDQVTSEFHAAYGCDRCGVTMTPQEIHEPCLGEQNGTEE